MDQKRIRILFLLCFIVYFSTYLGRLNYSAALSEMIGAEGFGKGQAGMIGTFFFVSYGIGQLISGFLGECLPGKWMIFWGLAVSGMANAAMGAMDTPDGMALVWCMNGLAQSFIWSPIIKILYEYLEAGVRPKLCARLNFSVPLGTMGAYLLTACLITVSNWRFAFYVPGVLLIVMAVLWYIGMTRIEAYAGEQGSGKRRNIRGIKRTEPVATGAGEQTYQQNSWKSMIRASGLCALLFALCVQGALKDGVTTWIPTYLGEKHNLGTMAAILSTMVVPLCNLFGVTLASMADRAIGRNEVKTSAVFFSFCGMALVVLLCLGEKSVLLALLMLAVSTTSMMAVNTMLISVLPSYFGKLGRASSVSGILNSSVYIGSAASTYGIGVLSAGFGWNATIFLWVAGAAASAVICFLVSHKWKVYVTKVLQ